MLVVTQFSLYWRVCEIVIAWGCSMIYFSHVKQFEFNENIFNECESAMIAAINCCVVVICGIVLTIPYGFVIVHKHTMSVFLILIVCYWLWLQ